MDRRSWLWRRKSSEKSPGETESSVGSISSHSERFSDDQVYLNHNPQLLEATSKVEHNDGVKTLSEKLSAAIVSINAKEELVKQHAKLAEEAVSGWEKAESEVLALRQQVEVLTFRNSTLEDRVVHLDGALKECLRQLRQTREEKDQIALEPIENKTSKTDADLHRKLENAEKENLDLKLELSSMAEELEIRLIEKELSNEAATKFEAECRKLNLILQKGNDHGSFRRNRIDPFLEIDLMDDFLEMERFAAMPETLKKVEKLEIDLKEHENELKTSRNRLEEVGFKLVKIENQLETAQARVEDINAKKEVAESRCMTLETEIETLLPKVENLETEVEKERDFSCNMVVKCRELEDEVSRLKREVENTKLANRAKELRFLRKKQDTELTIAGSKFAECQKTIASLNRKLKTLAKLDAFLIDTNDSLHMTNNGQ